MKRITITALAAALSVALSQPGFTSAKDEAQKDKEQGKQEKVQGKGKGSAGAREHASKASGAVSTAGRTSVSKHSAVANVKPSNVAPERSRVPHAKALSTVRDAVPTQTVTKQNAQNTRTTVRNSTVRNSQSTTFNYRSFNRTNNYGGRWVLGDTHRDWDRNRIHFWNNHRYRWYDGGWLIIDGGFWPPDYYAEAAPYRYSYSHSDYTSNGTAVAVQRRLADLGYYNGYADGIIGPVTRNAIANYQRDNGLAVTGRINDALLSSLGVG